MSKEFRVTRGTRQGGILSPALFNVFIDQLLTTLKESGTGVRIGTYIFNSVAYADDITLFASTIPGLQRLIDTCHLYSKQWLFRYGIKKTKCMVIGRCPFREPSWSLNGHPIENVDALEVLGVTFTPSRDFGQHTQKRQQSCRKAFYSLDSARILSPSLQPDLKAHLWRTAPQAALLYGCEAVPVTRRDIKSMESLQGTLVKQSLRVGKRSHHSN